ncbi:MAG: ribonuclease HI [Ideonella sp.]|nr:ribonuclease HI [Ideonella sp.]
MSWVVYADGACAPSNPGPSGWGAVVIPPGGQGESDHYGFIGPGTNQIAELTAAIEGLSRVPAGQGVELVSDSQYVLKGLSEWRAGWERRGFRNAKGEPVANLALWKRLFAIADERKVRTRWVRGHNGDVYNERADALANQALRLRGSSTG